MMSQSCEDRLLVYKEKTLEFEDLISLINEDAMAIHIKNFYSTILCEKVVGKLLKHPKKSHFNKASDIGRIGMAHFEIDGPESNENYHKEAIKNTRNLREIFEPYLSPVDKLRLLLDEIWPAGANIEVLYGRKCFVGICRIMEPTVNLLAHNDRLDRDSPDSFRAHSLLKQLSACVYLQTPIKGGGLCLWNREPKSEEDYKSLKNAGYGITLEKIGQPDIIIEPSQGDLLLFNTRKLHGVSPGLGGQRINVGIFIGYRGINQPLTYWS